ncbi:MAG TPA: sigma-70 family RNA polymerase sigma factor [Solirubrobacterales bacterium]|nr:sigma-70 family RNA polymerase sigma factor [Solirubrobacterales bacterium]
MTGSTRSARGEAAPELEAARGGDEAAFTALVQPYRHELTAHCYRMLGSLHDAEDALQEAMLRAWRGIARFEGRSSLRSWLYTIATNTCLNAIERRKPRLHPIDYGPRADPESGVPGMPAAESVWIEPYPDELLGVDDGPMAPEARYEAREAVELAFIAALQHLPPNQRAVLILREVLGYSARETAATLETSVASVNSALQRARATLESRLPDRSQQSTLRILGDDGVREVVEAYVEAWDREDIDGVVAMLTEEATFSMPPIVSWFGGPGGHDELRGFLRSGPLTGDWRWRHILTTANGQLALGFYCWYEPDQTHRPFALNVLSFEGRKISDVTCFINRSIESEDPEDYVRYPEQPLDRRRTEDFFLRFGLPDRVD